MPVGGCPLVLEGCVQMQRGCLVVVMKDRDPSAEVPHHYISFNNT